MSHVDYDRFAAGYHKRYEVNPLTGIGRALRDRAHGRVLEAGCGTGRWLAELPSAYGIDLSFGMLTQAPRRVAVADAVRLPFPDAAFDFVYCVNALHHFGDRNAYFREVRRVLREGGTTAAVAIDATRIANWFVYDVFDGAREIDLERYATLEQIGDMMAAAGFADIATEEVDRGRFSWSAEEVLSSPLVTRESNSLIALLSDEVFERGLERIRNSGGARFETDMPFYCVTGRLT